MTYCCPIQSTTSTGGIVVGGSALVENPSDPWDGMAGVWPLNEIGDGTAGEFKDRTKQYLDATGGDGTDIAIVPTIDEGVFCQPSQHFVERQFITVPADHVGMDQGFTISMWGKIQTFYQPRLFFSRGHSTSDGDEWVFTFGHTFLNQLTASIQTLASDGSKKTYTASGSTLLTQNQFYHFAASFQPGIGMKVYVNGVQDGLKAVSESLTQPLTNEGYMSKWNTGGFITGNIQDVRLHPVVRDAAWLLAEFHNYCQNGFFQVGGEQSPTG